MTKKAVPMTAASTARKRSLAARLSSKDFSFQRSDHDIAGKFDGALDCLSDCDMKLAGLMRSVEPPGVHDLNGNAGVMNGSSGTQFEARMPSRFHADNFTLFLVVLSMLGSALVLAREAAYGVVLSPDSLWYINAAQKLLAGEGLVNYDGSLYNRWPPLYPLLLAAASLGVFDPLDVAGPLNAAIFGLTVFVAGRWLRQCLHARFLAVWACFVLALSLPLADLASKAMSGPAFILLTTLALIRADRFLAEGRTSSLIWAGVFTALAWQTRYIGVAVPIAIGLMFLFQRGATLSQRAGRITLFSVIAAAPMMLWLLRTYLFTGKLVTNWSLVDYPLPQALGDTGRSLRTWLDFDLSWPSLEFLPPAAVAFVLTALAAALILAGCAFIQDRRRGQTRFSWRPAVIFGGFALVYLPLLIWSSVQSYIHHGIHPRFMAPLYIPLLTVAAFALDRFFLYERERKLLGRAGSVPILGRWSRGGQGSLLAVVLMAALFLWPAGQVVPHAHEISRANAPDARGGLGRQPWAGSETLRWIRENPLFGLVYSNFPPLIHLHNEGTVGYAYLPPNRPGGYRVAKESRRGAEPLEGWLDTVPDGTWVVSFDNWWDRSVYDYGVSQLLMTPGLEPVAVLADGVVFKVNKDYLPRSNPYWSMNDAIVSGDAGEPLVRSFFDLYLDGASLAYVKRPCVERDTEARFFLHLIPSDTADLPDERVQYGFDNLDFRFPDYGVVMGGGGCLVMVTLPGYDIDRIHTGQYVPGEGRLWEAIIPPGLN